MSDYRGIDFDLLRKLAEGTGGERTGALMRAGYIKVTLTPEGFNVLAQRNAMVLDALCELRNVTVTLTGLIHTNYDWNADPQNMTKVTSTALRRADEALGIMESPGIHCRQLRARPDLARMETIKLDHVTDGSPCWCDPEKRPDGVVVHREEQ